MISSTMPSAKYSCSGSPLILAKGSTAIDGLSGRGGPELDLRRWRAGGCHHPVRPDWARNILERLLAHVFESEIEAARRILLNARRDADAARLGQVLRAGPRR